MRMGGNEAGADQRVVDRATDAASDAPTPGRPPRPSRPAGVITVISTETIGHGEIGVTAVDTLGHALRVSRFRSVRPGVQGPRRAQELRFMTVGPRGTSGPSVALTLGEAEELVARLGEMVARLREGE